MRPKYTVLKTQQYVRIYVIYYDYGLMQST